jgi:hypothetical protein
MNILRKWVQTGTAAGLAAVLLAAAGSALADPAREQRREMVDRGLKFLVGIQQKEGAVGDDRPQAVTALFLLACLSSGVQPDDAEVGPAMRAAQAWILANSDQAFLGGDKEPNADHALAALALSEATGMAPTGQENLKLYAKAKAALQYSVDIQDQGVDPKFGGGWRPDDRTRVNDRVLSAWFLCQLRSNQLRYENVSQGSLDRATEFLVASQKGADEAREDERGGFSLGAAGLPVRSASAAGMMALALARSEPDRTALARAWLARHPPTWYGPHFYITHFFAVRGLYRTRARDGGKAFQDYFDRVVRLLRERQEADGRFPFPPGHGGPIVAMGPGYSTALAILILNVDRGFLPLDQ